jgi:DnaJ like chaperone protein
MTWNPKERALEAGGRLRDMLAAVKSRLGLDRLRAARPGHHTIAFTIAVTTLAAKMAKADGVATALEARTFEEVFTIPPHEAANVKRLYDLAKRDIAGYEIYASKIGLLLKDEPRLLASVLECLFNIAAADGILHPGEDRFLATVAERFGLSERTYQSIRASFVRDPASPYAVLDVAPDIADDALKARHRALVREHHPDRLAASGIPEDFRAAADRRLAAINAAYDEILAARAAMADSRKERCS